MSKSWISSLTPGSARSGGIRGTAEIKDIAAQLERSPSINRAGGSLRGIKVSPPSPAFTPIEGVGVRFAFTYKGQPFTYKGIPFTFGASA